MLAICASARRERRRLVIATLLVVLALPTAAHAAFGAIAYSPTADKVGYSWNARSRAAAEAHALRYCRLAAGMANDCRIVVSYENACGAVASGRDHHYGWATEPTEAQAEGRAMSYCRDRAGDSCHLIRVVCSDR